MNKSILPVLLLLIGACVPEGDNTIVIGAMFPLTGDGAAYGEPISRQVQLAIDEINAAGGINGKTLVLKLEDSKCNPKDGATAAQKLISVDGAKVIFGGACSGETLGAAPVAEQNKVVLISPSATSPDITTAGDFVFRTAPSDAHAGKVAAEHALTLALAKAAIIHETTDYAQGLKKAFESGYTAKGGSVVAVESFSSEDTDVKTQILKVRTAKPDVVYLAPQTPAKGILLVRQIKEQGLPQQLITAEVLIGRDVVKENPKILDGVIGIEQAFDEGAIATQALDAYRAKYGEPPWPFYQAAARDAVYLVANAMKKHGNDPEAIKNELYKTSEWEGAIGRLTIDENGDPLLGYSVKKVVDGQLVKV